MKTHRIENFSGREFFSELENTVEYAYAPYSNFPVAAGITTPDGKLITGVNVENRSFGLTNCAERTAVFKALTNGHMNFPALYLYCAGAQKPVPPCGACRQVLSEFAGADMQIFYKGKGPEIIATTLGELYPQDSLHELKNPAP